MVRPRTTLALALLVAAAPAATAHAASSTTISTQDVLTAHTQLRGTASFATPAGWRSQNAAPRPLTARFLVATREGCQASVTVSLRGVATRATPAAQRRRAVGDAPLGQATTAGHVWGIDGPLLGGGEGEGRYVGLYGISPRRAAPRRYGQLRVLAGVRGCSEAAAERSVAPGSRLVGQVAHLLARARADLRVAPASF